MGTGSLFVGVKWQESGVDYPPPHLATRLKKEYSYACTSSLGLHDRLTGELHFISK
jgi:hypothetical protein